MRLPELLGPSAVREAGSNLLGEDGVAEPTDGCEASALPQKHKYSRIPEGLRDFFWPHDLRDSVPRPRTELRVMAVKVLSPNHWIVRELLLNFLMF